LCDLTLVFLSLATTAFHFFLNLNLLHLFPALATTLDASHSPQVPLYVPALIVFLVSPNSSASLWKPPKPYLAPSLLFVVIWCALPDAAFRIIRCSPFGNLSKLFTPCPLSQLGVLALSLSGHRRPQYPICFDVSLTPVPPSWSRRCWIC